MDEVLRRCRRLYHSAGEHRLPWWRRGQGQSATRFQPEAEWKDLRAAFPDYAASPRHVLQEVLACLDKT